MIYLSLLTVSFMVATIIPFGSEMYFGTLLSLGKYNNFLLLVSASIGNVLGSVFNWTCGYYVNYFIKKPWFPISEKKANFWFFCYIQWIFKKNIFLNFKISFFINIFC